MFKGECKGGPLNGQMLHCSSPLHRIVRPKLFDAYMVMETAAEMEYKIGLYVFDGTTWRWDGE